MSFTGGDTFRECTSWARCWCALNRSINFYVNRARYSQTLLLGAASLSSSVCSFMLPWRSTVSTHLPLLVNLRVVFLLQLFWICTTFSKRLNFWLLLCRDVVPGIIKLAIPNNLVNSHIEQRVIELDILSSLSTFLKLSPFIDFGTLLDLYLGCKCALFNWWMPHFNLLPLTVKVLAAIFSQQTSIAIQNLNPFYLVNRSITTRVHVLS